MLYLGNKKIFIVKEAFYFVVFFLSFSKIKHINKLLKKKLHIKHLQAAVF